MATRVVDLGSVIGPQGPAGPAGAKGTTGAAGKSAYQQAVDAGYTGTEAAFYAALVSLKDGPFLPLAGGELSGPLRLDINQMDPRGGTLSNIGGVKVEASGFPRVSIVDDGAGGEIRIFSADAQSESEEPTFGFCGNGTSLVPEPTSSYNVASKKYVDTQTVRLGTCTTAAGTAAKVATQSGFILQTGAMVCVKFTYANTSTTATLNVNSTGAKSIRVNGAAIKSNMILAGMYALFQYDGTYFQLLNPAGLPLNGGTMTGVLTAQTNTSYSTYQVRNAALLTSAPSSMSNGAVALVYN